jgi:hypothetical protein
LNFIFGIVCLFVCVCAFSLRRESPDMILGDKPLIFEVVLSHVFSTASTWRRSEAPASCRRSEASAWRRRRGGAHRGHGGGCAVEGAWWRADAE